MNRTTLFVGIFLLLPNLLGLSSIFNGILIGKKSKLIWSDCELNPMVHPD